jgi:glycerol-3-phosphate O-acyltransferase
VKQDAPIFRFNDARASIVGEVVARVMSRDEPPLAVLSDAIYHEVRRLTASGDEAGLARWRALARRLPLMSEDERRSEARALAEEHAWDVAGNFSQSVYSIASRLVAPVLGAIVAPRATLTSPRRMLDLRALGDRIAVQGDVEHVAKLHDLGTVVYVPTHLSNLDSPVFGYALEQAGLPPATYGAGKNLFTNPVLSFFMHNLGAYRVDRRLRHALYKDVLKTYSCVLLERGYHSLFFPGGTRSRSGGVERRLKLGLAGTGVEAFANTAREGRARSVFFVPVTISYLVTLEAETLINDYLQEAGKARFIIEDDESSRLARVAAFAEKLLRHDAGVVVRFAEPLDPFGNRVGPAGETLGGRGRMVDSVSYLRDRQGDIVSDAARDAQYTRELGQAICDAYVRHTVALSTHVVAGVMLNRLRAAASTDDLFALLRVRQRIAVPRAQIAADVEAMRDRLLALEREGAIVVGPSLRRASGDAIIAEALRAWRGAHTTPVVEETEGMLSVGSAPLVFYYQNRLAAHGVVLDALGAAPPRRVVAARAEA